MPIPAFSASPVATLSLLLAAFIWGVIWYPYRLLEGVGIAGGLATLVTYFLALVLALPFYHGQWRPPPGCGRTLAVMALLYGGTNLAYVLAVIQGEVMRVLLLFYLAPLWTVLFARLLLGERPGPIGYLVVALALTGAVVMLHGGQGGWPLPAGVAEWLGLAAGLGFALANVLTRRLDAVPVGARALWIFAGVVLVALPAALWPVAGGQAVVPSMSPAGLGLQGWGLLGITSLGLVAATLSVQHGLVHVSANRAIVLLLSELVWAAISSAWLAGEAMAGRDWLGGAMIVAATLLTGRMEKRDVPH